MAQEAIHITGEKRVGRAWAGRRDSRFLPESATSMVPKSSDLILSALGDDSSRKILTSAIAAGKTVEDISAEQNLPLSTCYRRVRHFVDEGLMVLERLVVTPAGTRFAIYRTSFSNVTIRFFPGEINVEATPNLEVIDKLRARWMSRNYPAQSRCSLRREDGSLQHGLKMSGRHLHSVRG
jgi:hypothetical protein